MAMSTQTLINNIIYEITVKNWMLKKTEPNSNFDWMEKFNKNIPMPAARMTGFCVKETPGMYYMTLRMSEVPYTEWTGWVAKSAIIVARQMSLMEHTAFEKKVKSVEEFHIDIDIYKKTEDKFGMTVTFSDESETLAENLKKKFYARRLSGLSYQIAPECLEDVLDELELYKVNINNPFNYTVNDEFRYDLAPLIENYPTAQWKTTPYKHQEEAYDYGMQRNSFLLADDQGLGKSMESINIAVGKRLQYGYRHCLVICCVNTLKWNWKEEVAIHSNEKGYILGQREITRGSRKGQFRIGSTKDKISDIKNLAEIEEYFVITNVESLQSPDVKKALVQAEKSGQIGMIIVDEFHKAINTTSKMGKHLSEVTAVTRIAMSGTPILNSPLDLYAIFKWLGYEKHSKSTFTRFYGRKGGYEDKKVVGYRHMDIMQNNLARIMLRRKKEDVLDLPDKIYINEYLEMSDAQAKLYEEIRSGLIEQLQEIELSPNPLARMAKLRQASSHTSIISDTLSEGVKFERLIEKVEDIVAEDKKVIIFSNWTSVTDIAVQVLAKYNPLVITGATADEDRISIKETFQTNPERKVLIGTIGAMGTGLTLTAAENVIFLDEPWTNAQKEQAVDRAHRIGTKNKVLVYTFLCKNTIDEKVHALVETKKDISAVLVDNKQTGKVARFLLGL